MEGKVEVSSAGARYTAKFAMEVDGQPHRKGFQRKSAKVQSSRKACVPLAPLKVFQMG